MCFRFLLIFSFLYVIIFAINNVVLELLGYIQDGVWDKRMIVQNIWRYNVGNPEYWYAQIYSIRTLTISGCEGLWVEGDHLESTKWEQESNSLLATELSLPQRNIW